METPVSRYFDQIAGDYRRRYDLSARPYHRYLHHQRLKIAMAGLHFEGKRILDVGAGTGSLYDAICKQVSEPEYFACDVSGEMLRQSNIPESRRAVGALGEVTLPHASFDLAFMLGVSTYLDAVQLNETLRAITANLAPGGVFVISFTNPRSLDWHLRSLIRRFWRGRGVIGQSFETHGYLPEAVPLPLRLVRAEWYNFSLTPLNTLLPAASARIAEWGDRRLPEALRRPVCADIVARYTL